MALLHTLAPLGLVGMFVGNKLGFALATESYGMAYIPMRVAVIPACASLVVAGSVFRWWIARRDAGAKNEQQLWHLAGAIIGISIWAFQWFSAGTLFSR